LPIAAPAAPPIPPPIAASSVELSALAPTATSIGIKSKYFDFILRIVLFRKEDYSFQLASFNIKTLACVIAQT
jgi:hypothetical protein